MTQTQEQIEQESLDGLKMIEYGIKKGILMRGNYGHELTRLGLNEFVNAATQNHTVKSDVSDRNELIYWISAIFGEDLKLKESRYFGRSLVWVATTYDVEDLPSSDGKIKNVLLHVPNVPDDEKLGIKAGEMIIPSGNLYYGWILYATFLTQRARKTRPSLLDIISSEDEFLYQRHIEDFE